jgi:AAA family ATP:ADP antiporter
VGLHGLLKVVGNWTYSLFFCMAELWGAVIISVLFWWVFVGVWRAD